MIRPAARIGVTIAGRNSIDSPAPQTAWQRERMGRVAPMVEPSTWSKITAALSRTTWRDGVAVAATGAAIALLILA